MRLGLFGGTFNPIHFGHLRAAEEIREALCLDRLLFIPAALPPHKASHHMVPFATRLEMTRLAVADETGFEVSDVEGRRPEKSYSIDTLCLFRQELSPDTDLFFILGLDAFLEIDTWKDFRQLFRLCHFVVLDRPGYDRGQLERVLTTRVHPDCRYDAEAGTYLHPAGSRIHFHPITLLEISSTAIRTAVSQGRSIRFLLPEAVRRYILLNKLYFHEENTYANQCH